MSSWRTYVVKQDRISVKSSTAVVRPFQDYSRTHAQQHRIDSVAKKKKMGGIYTLSARPSAVDLPLHVPSSTTSRPRFRVMFARQNLKSAECSRLSVHPLISQYKATHQRISHTITAHVELFTLLDHQVRALLCSLSRGPFGPQRQGADSRLLFEGEGGPLNLEHGEKVQKLLCSLEGAFSTLVVQAVRGHPELIPPSPTL